MKTQSLRFFILLCLIFSFAVPILGQRDTDGDGLDDSVDNCPRQAGPRSNLGCPIRVDDSTPEPTRNPNDSDGDGTPDNTDACPNEGGPAYSPNNGCPDGAIPEQNNQNQERPVVQAILPTSGDCVLATISIDRVNVRAEPNRDSAIIRTLSPEEIANVYLSTSLNGETWYFIGDGWVLGSLVRFGGDCSHLLSLNSLGGLNFRPSENPDGIGGNAFGVFDPRNPAKNLFIIVIDPEGDTKILPPSREGDGSVFRFYEVRDAREGERGEERSGGKPLVLINLSWDSRQRDETDEDTGRNIQFGIFPELEPIDIGNQNFVPHSELDEEDVPIIDFGIDGLPWLGTSAFEVILPEDAIDPYKISDSNCYILDDTESSGDVGAGDASYLGMNLNGESLNYSIGDNGTIIFPWFFVYSPTISFTVNSSNPNGLAGLYAVIDSYGKRNINQILQNQPMINATSHNIETRSIGFDYFPATVTWELPTSFVGGIINPYTYIVEPPYSVYMELYGIDINGDLSLSFDCP